MEFKIDVNTEMWRREETLSKVKGFNVEYVEEWLWSALWSDWDKWMLLLALLVTLLHNLLALFQYFLTVKCSLVNGFEVLLKLPRKS